MRGTGDALAPSGEADGDREAPEGEPFMISAWARACQRPPRGRPAGAGRTMTSSGDGAKAIGGPPRGCCPGGGGRCEGAARLEPPSTPSSGTAPEVDHLGLQQPPY